MRFKILKESREKSVVLYHGSTEKQLKIDNKRRLYAVDDKDVAVHYATEYSWDYTSEIHPTIYTLSVQIENPLILDNYSEYDDYMDETNRVHSDDELKRMGYDSVIYNDNGSNLYMLLYPENQAKIINSEKI